MEKKITPREDFFSEETPVAQTTGDFEVCFDHKERMQHEQEESKEYLCGDMPGDHPFAREAYSALDAYTDSGFEMRSDFREHAQRIQRTIEDYAGDKIAQQMINVIPALHDLAGRAMHAEEGSSSRTMAAATLANFFKETKLDVDFKRLAVAILGDISYIDVEAKELRSRTISETNNKELQRALLEDTAVLPADERLWMEKGASIDIEQLKRVADTANVESLIFKAAEVLDHVMYPSPNDSSILSNTLEIESFHAPMMEVLGMDAFAMKLRTEAVRACIQKWDIEGGEGYIHIAEKINQEALRSEHLVLPKILGADTEVRTVFKLYTPYTLDDLSDCENKGEIISYRKDEITEGLFAMAFKSRIKTVGSIAKKIYRDKEKLENADSSMLMDPLAMTFIADSPEEMALYYALKMHHVLGHELIVPKPAYSKEKAFFVQGTQEFVDTFMLQIPQELHEKIEQKCIKKDAEEVYQVAKMTMLVDEKACEVQFLTIDEDRKARIGRTAHILFKAGVKPEEAQNSVQWLAGIMKRRDDYDPIIASINPRSLDNAKRLKDALLLQGHRLDFDLVVQ